MSLETPQQPENEKENKAERLLEILGNIKTPEGEEALELAKEIIKEARIDYLTGLKNREGFTHEVEKLFAQVERFWVRYESGPPSPEEIHVKIDDMAVVFIDIDDFKDINDIAGHLAGDEVLREVAQMLRKAFRASDQFGRWGGEELVVGMVGANEEDALKKVKDLQALLTQIKIPNHPELSVSVSAGVASIRDSGANDLEELIGLADKAMYEAKNKGKKTAVAYREIKE